MEQEGNIPNQDDVVIEIKDLVKDYKIFKRKKDRLIVDSSVAILYSQPVGAYLTVSPCLT